MTTRLARDGVLTANGLTADFRLLYVHPNCPGCYRIQTAAGDSYANEAELTWEMGKGAVEIGRAEK